jgi:hypothetical protein
MTVVQERRDESEPHSHGRNWTFWKNYSMNRDIQVRFILKGSLNLLRVDYILQIL